MPRRPLPEMVVVAALAAVVVLMVLSTFDHPAPTPSPATRPGSTAPTVLPIRKAAPCSQGLVALTFDDGPHPVYTPRLLRLLEELDVQATFFMIGEHVQAHPSIAGQVADAGHVIGNHTWSHPRLVRLSEDAMRGQLRATDKELRAAGVVPSGLMRQTYGLTSRRLVEVVSGLGLVPVFWTVDPRDWKEGTSAEVADRVVAGLRPHEPNIVLLHDGVGRSAVTVAAVPRIVRAARAMGYCFTGIGPDARLDIPVPALSVEVTDGAEGRRRDVRVRLVLDRPTSRPVSVRVATISGKATAGSDFAAVSRRVVFPVGATRSTVTIPVAQDSSAEGVERFTVRLTQPRGLLLKRGTWAVRIAPDDAGGS